MSDGPGVRERLRYAVSERLRQRRRDLGLTQQELAARLDAVGVRTTNKALSGLEHGVGLDVAKLPGLAFALDCSVTFLLGLTDDPSRWEPDVGLLPRPAVAKARPMSEPTHPSILGPDVPDLYAGTR